MTDASLERLDTLPKYLYLNHRRWKNRVAIRKKKYGIWNEYSWQHHYNQVKYFTLGLIDLGLQKGDKTTIVGDSDPEWTWAQMAVLSAGGVVAGAFTESLPHELKYIVTHSDSRFIVAHDQEQVDKILEIKDELPLVEKVIYWETKGMRDYDDPVLVYYYDVVERGREVDRQDPERFEKLLAEGDGEDVAMIYYTSGTTGLPKGAIRTHKSMLHTMRGALQIFKSRPMEDYVAIVPPAWIAAMMGESGHWLTGMVINYPEKPETAMMDLREISPAAGGGNPRIWEGLVSIIQAKITDAGPINRALYKIFLPVGYRVADCHLAGKKATTGAYLLNFLADRLVFRQLRNQLGFRKTRYFNTGAAAISPDTFRYFHAIGCPIRQFYGSTESGSVCGHWGDLTQIRFETIGPPMEGVQVRISDEGEIQVKSEGMFSGYHKNPEATTEAIVDGWFRTGDAGYINEEGHVIYIDRVKELGRLKNGGNYSPQYIEGSLRFSPYLREAVTIGGREREYLTAILNINFDNVGRWAEKNRINYTTYVDLSQKEEVARLLLDDVHRVNKNLPDEVKIRKFAILHKEIDADEAEMTRTMKLRRGLFAEKYEELLDALYSGRDAVEISAAVTYRDGRKGTIKTHLRIWNVE
ncbi:MAG: AMP-binding protein [Proteobacteria bacterium]|nr:AMP-binding protein [Pseudomonadota bacterium]